MEKGWQHRPGDRVLRRPRIAEERPKRTLGIPSLFGAAYGNAGSSIYYALGIVALIALGATPIVLLLAGLLFILTTLSYAECTAMLPEAGGAATFARHGFNNLIGFIAGWASMLGYIATIAICAYAIPPYLGYFSPSLKESAATGTAVAMGVILFLMLINVIGMRESSRLSVLSAGLDLITQISIVVLGIAFIVAMHPMDLANHMFGEGNWPPNWAQLTHGIDDYWPKPTSLVFGIALATIAFRGVETISQMADETRHPQKRSPRTLLLMTATVLVLFTGMSVVALGALDATELSDPGQWAKDGVAGIAANMPYEPMQHIYKPLVAILATAMLLLAANAGVAGVSRLAFTMGTQKHLPVMLSRVHYRFRTPYISIIVFCTIAIFILLPGINNEKFFEDVGALYVFGALLSFAFVHASILSLRLRKPEMERPFKLRFGVNISGRQFPITAAIGLAATLGIWLVIVVAEDYSRALGFLWMAAGLIGYYLYRRRRKLPLT